MYLNRLLIFVFVCLAAACSSSKKQGGEHVAKDNVDYSGPPATVYKTTKNYNKNVPVTLSEDKTKVVAYPAPTDVFYKGALANPIELKDGYLLDNRGVSIHTAFTKYTYEEYSKLKEAPDPVTLFNSIIDKEPIKEMYNCGNRYNFKNEAEELNSIITQHKLNNYKKIK
jgi:hypothetical protein